MDLAFLAADGNTDLPNKQKSRIGGAGSDHRGLDPTTDRDFRGSQIWTISSPLEDHLADELAA